MLSSCPTNWKMTPEQALDYTKNEMQEIFPLGVFKEVK
jgi:2-oxoglutarate ferredoxin oxidoreductase subunit beta